MQLHAQLHKQIHGNIFIRVIYSKQRVQLETEKVFPPHSYVTNRTANGIRKDSGKTQASARISLPISLRGVNTQHISLYLITNLIGIQ